MVCTFFGHRNTPERIRPLLREVLTELIEKRGVDKFYVGNQGSFDYYVRKELNDLSKYYPHIEYYVVLAYIHGKKDEDEDYYQTIYPGNLGPRRFAIDKRNRWMIERSDIVVTYVQFVYGGAAKFKELAEKKGKEIINLGDDKGV